MVMIRYYCLRAGWLACALLPVLPVAAQKAEKAAIKAVIERFFEGLERGDTTILKSACTPQLVLQTFAPNREGVWQVSSVTLAQLVAAVARPRTNTWDEQIVYKTIALEPNLASVWTPYRFLIDGKVSHSGTNSFQLVKTVEGWKIQYIIDTRRKQA
jgi:Putative lumazine-binding